MYFNPSSTSLCLQHVKKMLGASGGLRIVARAKKSDFIPSDLTRNSLLPSFFRYDRVPRGGGKFRRISHKSLETKISQLLTAQKKSHKY